MSIISNSVKTDISTITDICNHTKCKKSLDFFSVTCKCGNHYCMKHKNSFDHKCTFNYISEAKKKLEYTIPKIIPNKLEQI